MSHTASTVILSGTPRRIWPEHQRRVCCSSDTLGRGQILRRVRLRMTVLAVFPMTAVALLALCLVASAQTTRPSAEPHGQQVYLRETDPNSPRKSKLKSDK